MKQGIDYIIVAIAVFVAALFFIDDEEEVQAERDRIACEHHRIWLDDTFNRVPVTDRQGAPIHLTEFYKQCGEL